MAEHVNYNVWKIAGNAVAQAKYKIKTGQFGGSGSITHEPNWTEYVRHKAADGAEYYFLIPMPANGAGRAISIIPWDDNDLSEGYAQFTYEVLGTIDKYFFSALPTPVSGTFAGTDVPAFHIIAYPLTALVVKVVFTSDDGWISVVGN